MIPMRNKTSSWLLVTLGTVILGTVVLYAGFQHWPGEGGNFLVVVAVVFMLAGANGFLPESSDADEEPEAAAVVQEMKRDGDIDTDIESVPDGEQEARFVVIQNHQDDQIELAEGLLEGDSRVERVSHDEGRYYSNPDREDLPLWFSLWVFCREKDCEALMVDLNERLDKALGEETNNKLEITSV